MKHARFQRLYRDQSSEVKKVYDAMPKSEGWTAQQVLNELIRQQRPMRLEVIAGVLGHLAQVGLAKQSGNRYQLVPVEAPIVETATKSVDVIPNKFTTEIETTMGITPPKNEPADITVLGIFEKLSLRAGELQQRAYALQVDIGDFQKSINQAALDAASLVDKDSAELVKLRQLKNLLKDLG